MASSCKKCGLTCCMHPVDGMVCTCNLQPYRPTTTDRLAAIVKGLRPEWFEKISQYPAGWTIHHIEFDRRWMLSYDAYTAQEAANHIRTMLDQHGPHGAGRIAMADDGEIFFRCPTSDGFELLVMGTPQTA